jgi:uncharacterized protein (TIGR00369 family)
MPRAYTAIHPHYAARVRDSIASQPFMSRLLGTVVERVEPGRVDLSLALAPDLMQPHGNVHGTVATALADSAAGYAAQTLLGPEADVVTVEYKVNFLAPGIGERLYASGTVLRAGRTLYVCEARVEVLTADARKDIVHMLTTMMAVGA